MAVATSVVTVTNAFAEVIDILKTTWSMQNISTNYIFVFLKTTAPAASDKGHILKPNETFTQLTVGVGDVWVRNAGVGNLANLGSATAIAAGIASPQIAISQ